MEIKINELFKQIYMVFPSTYEKYPFCQFPHTFWMKLLIFVCLYNIDDTFEFCYNARQPFEVFNPIKEHTLFKYQNFSISIKIDAISKLVLVHNDKKHKSTRGHFLENDICYDVTICLMFLLLCFDCRCFSLLLLLFALYIYAHEF
jgi:hypothetical protein